MRTMNAARPPALVAFRLYTGWAWLVSLAAAAGMLLVKGTVTAIIENPFFTRMTPVRSVDYPVWVLSALLFGLVIGSFTIPLPGQHEGKLLSGATLSFLAAGSAVCNKPVVLLLGASDALTFFAPAQVLLGLASIALLGWTLRLRLDALSASCPLARPLRAAGLKARTATPRRAHHRCHHPPTTRSGLPHPHDPQPARLPCSA